MESLLRENIIEPSRSPWRAQVVISSGEGRKRRLVIDYSQTINRFTVPDSYPLPRIDQTVKDISQYAMYSVIDLRKAYYQLEIDAKEREFTAFQAGKELYQFRRVPMGVTNGVSAFQRFINGFIKKHKLKATFAYLDDLTVCGRTKAEHDENLAAFMSAASADGLSLNSAKSKFGLNEICVLGYLISKGLTTPDPHRMKLLKEFPPPTTKKTLQRCLGLFAYYARWVKNFSEKVKPLVRVTEFPLPSDAVNAFEAIKNDIIHAGSATIDEDVPFSMETDASNDTVAGTLLQDGRPVAFYSRTLNPGERIMPIIEKEALAIVECIRKWRQFVCLRRFVVITDQ